MKKAAFKSGCAYWDLFEAMGGLNSMPQWVKSKPALATSDYVHFTDLGARVMGKMFCAALNQEYEKYIKTIH
jgi:lysophospholipase L1-like esterase